NPRLVPSLAGCPRLPPTATSVSLPPAISCPAASIPRRREGGAVRPKGRAQSLSCPARNTSGRRMLAESWINLLLESLLTGNNVLGMKNQQRTASGRFQLGRDCRRQPIGQGVRLIAAPISRNDA